jgi:hypothetical protein
MTQPLTRERLEHLLSYDPLTQSRTWNFARGGCRKGERAGLNRGVYH